MQESSRMILRYALGSTFMVALAMGYGWELSFLLPILGLDFLSAGKDNPSLREAFKSIAIISMASIVGLLFSYLFLQTPIIHILLTFLLLLFLFYTNSSFISPMVKVWLIIAVMLIPNVALLSIDLAETIAGGLMINMALAILVVWFIFAIIPKRVTSKNSTAIVAQKEETPKQVRFKFAITNTLVIMPVYLLFYYYQLSSYLLILIFIALLSMQPAFAKNFKGGFAMILGNLIGGLLSILVYELLTVVPTFGFLIVLVLISGLFLGSRAFSDRKTAKLYAMGFSTFLLIICSVTGSGTLDAGAKLWSRILQIMLAVTYVVLAFGLINRFRESR